MNLTVLNCRSKSTRWLY